MSIVLLVHCTSQPTLTVINCIQGNIRSSFIFVPSFRNGCQRANIPLKLYYEYLSNSSAPYLLFLNMLSIYTCIICWKYLASVNRFILKSSLAFVLRKIIFLIHTILLNFLYIYIHTCMHWIHALRYYKTYLEKRKFVYKVQFLSSTNILVYRIKYF